MMKNKKPLLFYGYVVVTAAFSILMIAWGSNRTFGIFLEPMLNEFGWTRAGISGAFTLAMILTGAAAIVAGRLTDRFGPRLVLISCGFLLGLGYILVSQINTMWQFYLFYGVMTGVAMSGAAAPLMSVIARWFYKNRALMTGIITAGPSLGIVVMPLVFSMLIQAYDWRVSYIILGGTVLAVILPAALFLKRDPGQMGLMPHGTNKESTGDFDLQKVGFSLGDAMRTRQFWLLSVIGFCDMFLVNVVTVHIVIHAIGLGFTPATAASVLSIAAGVSIPARIMVGGIADRIGSRKALTAVLITSVFAFVLLLVARELWTLYLFAALYGVGLWASFVVVSPLVADLFGLKSHGTILAFIVLASTMGGAVGPVLAGYIFDVSSSYQPAFLLCLALTLISLTAIICLRPIKHQ